jgi:hypothetical protein
MLGSRHANSTPGAFCLSSSEVAVWPESPFPLGATYDGAGTNLSRFSVVVMAHRNDG